MVFVVKVVGRCVAVVSNADAENDATTENDADVDDSAADGSTLFDASMSPLFVS